MTQLEVSNR